MNILELKKLDWNIINSYFNNDHYYFTQSQINSYNDFITNRLPYTIKTLNPFTMIKKDENTDKIKHKVNIYIGNKDGNEIYLGKPVLHENNKTKPLYPNESRLKDLDYVSDLYANILIEYITYDSDNNENIIPKTYSNMNLGVIPIMTHSKLCILNEQPLSILTEMGECPYDQGGYFIISGKEKVIISQERIATNKLFVRKTKVNEEHINDIEPTPYSYEAEIRCTSEENILFPKTINFRIFKNKKKLVDGKYENIKKLEKRQNAIILTCPNIKKGNDFFNIPLFIMFRALGIESDKEILNYILTDIENPYNKQYLNFLRYSILDSNYIYSQNEALEYLSQYVDYNKNKEDGIDNLKYILTNDFLPNIGKDFNNKALYLGYLVKKIIKVRLGIVPQTNRDNYLYKRVDLSGYQLSNLFRDLYNKLRNNILNTIDRQYLINILKDNNKIENLVNENNISKIFDPLIIKDGMIKSLKGSWAQAKSDASDTNVVQDLERLSYLAYLSQVRRINTPIDRDIKFLEPRRVSGTQYGCVCPIESPDGINIGLVKHFSILTSVSYDLETDNIKECLLDNGMVELENISTSDINNSIKIFINYNWIGIHFDPVYIYKVLKTFRRIGLIDNTISISWYVQDYELHILADSGRLFRPLYIIEDNKLLLDDSDKLNSIKKDNIKWNELINSPISGDFNSKVYNKKSIQKFKKDGKIDFKLFEDNLCLIENIDVEESNTSMIAMNRKYLENKNINYTHCEIDPSTVLSAYTNIIPFADHNQYPRNAFSSKQGYSAIGIYATNFNNRIDTSSYIIHYPQRALIHTKYTKYVHNEELPNGENVIVAIATYTGFNQEDSIIVNKNSIERGMFNITKFKALINEESISENDEIKENNKFSNPLELQNEGTPINFKKRNWTHIDKDGIPKVNSYIEEDDVIVGKVRTTKEYKEDKSEDNIFHKKVENINYTDTSVVGSRTYKGFIDKVYTYETDNNLKKIKIRFRKFMIPELGDKMGSRHGQKGVCGMIYNQEDMPFNKDGLVPDIIINPHAIPSRMTIGHLVECVLCKLGCKMAVSIDGTTFSNQKTKELYNLMDKKDLHKYGDEILYNGYTGKQIDTHIFIGPTYYYRMKHLVSDKINSRNGHNEGPITTMTRQPTSGRANDGGLRIGEMEKDSIIGHGLASFLKESMMERSDKFNYYIENKHGTIAIGNNKDLKSSFKNENTFDYSELSTPYSYKLLLQEIESNSINVKMITDKNHTFDEHYENSSLHDLEKKDYIINYKFNK